MLVLAAAFIGYSIVSEYTSFLVLENDAEYQRWKLERRNALRIERDRKRQRQLDAQLASIRRAVGFLGLACERRSRSRFLVCVITSALAVSLSV
jgi:hypothetical protein